MRYTPVHLLVAFIGLTFLLNVAGPISYVGFNALLTGGFLLLICISMQIGFTTGVRSFLRERVEEQPQEYDIRPILYGALGLACGGLVFSIVQSLLAGTLNLSAANIGQSYIDSYADYERNTGSYSIEFIVYSLTAPASFIASVWGILYFRRIAFPVKMAVIFLILGSVLFYTIGSGKQKQLGDTVIYFLAVWGIVYGRSGRTLNVRVVSAAVVAVFLAIVGMVAILGQRYEALAIDIFNINVRGHPLMDYDLDHPVFKWLGYDVGFGFTMLSGYLSQGYFGLSLSLEAPSTWTYMIGFSYSLMVIADRVFGLPFLVNDTYPYIVGAQTGWNETKWHSIFPHWASDFGFSGTVILFGFFAFLYAKAWNKSISSDDPASVLMFAMLTLGAIFIPANNQLFITPGSLATVLVVTVIYLFHSGKTARRSS